MFIYAYLDAICGIFVEYTLFVVFYGISVITNNANITLNIKKIPENFSRG